MHLRLGKPMAIEPRVSEFVKRKAEVSDGS